MDYNFGASNIFFSFFLQYNNDLTKKIERFEVYINLCIDKINS